LRILSFSREALESLSISIGIFFTASAFVLLLDRHYPLPFLPRLILLLLILLLPISYLSSRIRAMIPLLLDPRSLALALERKVPELKDSLITSVECGDEAGISGKFLEVVASQAIKALKAQGIGRILEIKGLIVPLMVLALSSLIYPLYIASEPYFASVSIRRILLLEKDPEIELYPGDAYMQRGGSVCIRAEADRPIPRPPVLEWDEGKGWRRSEMKGFGSSFSFYIPKLEGDFAYRARCGAMRSRNYRISALDPPYFEISGLELLPPPYTGLPPISIYPKDEVYIPVEGTALSLKALASRRMAEVYIVVTSRGKGRRVPVALFGTRIEGVVRISSGDLSVFLEGRDVYGILGRSNPIALRVGTDLPPNLAVIEPVGDLEVEGWSGNERIAFKAGDDFGISSVSAVVEKMDGTSLEETVMRCEKPEKEVVGAFVLDLGSLGRIEGDSISVRIKAFDNRPGSPNVALSTPVRISIIHGSRVHEIVASRISEVSERMERDVGLARDSAPQGVGSWGERKEAREGLEGLGRASAAGSELIKEMLGKGGLDPATVARLERVKRVLEGLSGEDMRSVLERLKDPGIGGKEMDVSKLKYNEFLSIMEKVVESLKRIKREEELRSILRGAGELISKNEYLLSEVEGLSKGRTSGVSRISEEERAFARRIEGFSGKIRRFMDELRDRKDRWLDYLRDSLEEIEGSMLSREMEMAASDVELGMWERAASRHRKAFDTLSSASRKIMRALDEMMAEDASSTTNLILSAIDRACYISRVEGEILESLKGFDRDPRRFLTTFQRDSFLKELLEKHMHISAEVVRLSRSVEDIARRSLFLGISAMGFIKELEDAASEAERGLRESGSAIASSGISKVVASSNRLSLLLIEALGNAASDRILVELGQAMAQLELLTAMQMGLSRESGEGKRGGKEIMRRQGEIRGDLERVRDMLEEAGEDMAGGEVGKAVEESKDVERRLEGGESPKALRKEQERIAERMLRAYRIAFGEGEGKRVAEAARSQGKAITPVSLPPDLLKRKQGKRVSLGDLASEGYPKAYEDLVKGYFEALGKGW
jgi:hypothetical protein